MRVLDCNELSQISGGDFADGDASYMCTYSLVQYQNTRFHLLDLIYQGEDVYRGENPYNVTYFNDAEARVEMYKSWVSNHCSGQCIEGLM